MHRCNIVKYPNRKYYKDSISSLVNCFSLENLLIFHLIITKSVSIFITFIGIIYKIILLIIGNIKV